MESEEQEILEENKILIEYHDEEFVDPTPNDPIDKDDILIWLLEKEKEVNEESSKNEKNFQDSLLIDIEDDKQFQKELVEKFDLLLTDNQENETSNLTTSEQVLVKLDSVIENQEHLKVGNNTIATYGLLYIPLAIILFLLWRFFSTFLRTIR